MIPISNRFNSRFRYYFSFGVRRQAVIGVISGIADSDQPIDDDMSVLVTGEWKFVGTQSPRDYERPDRVDEYEQDRPYPSQYDEPEGQRDQEYPFHNFNYGP